MSAVFAIRWARGARRVAALFTAPGRHGGRLAARAACALLLPASLACHADGALQRLDLRMPTADRGGPRFMLVPEPADEWRGDTAASRRLAFVANEQPIDLPVGALRVRLSQESSVSLRPRRGGVALAWRKKF